MKIRIDILVYMVADFGLCRVVALSPRQSDNARSRQSERAITTTTITGTIHIIKNKNLIKKKFRQDTVQCKFFFIMCLVPVTTIDILSNFVVISAVDSRIKSISAVTYDSND